MGIWPSFILRCLYHTKYLLSEFEKRFDKYAAYENLINNSYIGIDYVEDGLNDPYKGREFSYYLDKIQFL